MKIGDTFKGKITGIKPYGAFIELEDGQTGLVHISEIKTGYVDNIYDQLSLDQAVSVQVIDIDEYSQKASLSMRSLEQESQATGNRHRFSNSRYKIGFKPLGDNLTDWIAEGMAYIKAKKEDEANES